MARPARLTPCPVPRRLARLEAQPGAAFAATTVLVQDDGGNWVIGDSGGDGVGCGTASQHVLVDLGLFCAATGGGTR